MNIDKIAQKIKNGVGSTDEELKFFLNYVENRLIPVGGNSIPLRELAYTIIAADGFARHRFGDNYRDSIFN
jgi:hypothetical protein